MTDKIIQDDTKGFQNKIIEIFSKESRDEVISEFSRRLKSEAVRLRCTDDTQLIHEIIDKIAEEMKHD